MTAAVGEKRKRGGSKPGRKRVHTACQPCRARKVKCDRLQECSSCLLHGSQCYYYDAEPLIKDPDDQTLAEMRNEIVALRALVRNLSSYPGLQEELLDSAGAAGAFDSQRTAHPSHGMSKSDDPQHFYPSPPEHLRHQSLPTGSPPAAFSQVPFGGHANLVKYEEDFSAYSDDSNSSDFTSQQVPPYGSPDPSFYHPSQPHLPLRGAQVPPIHPAHMLLGYYHQALNSEAGQLELLRSLGGTVSPALS